VHVRHHLRVALWLSAVPITVVAAQGPTQKPDPLDEPYKGVTTNGAVMAGLFPIRSTGVSTAPVRAAAVAFLGSLTPDHRAKTAFPVDDLEWRKWNNVHRYARQGVSFKEMSEDQRTRAFALLAAGLSAKGLEKSRNIMRLNETIAEMTKRFDEYGEGLYYLTLMGEPSDTAPWGWQLDGHHLIVNSFILRDQVVMTPTFMGSEPVHAEAGKYAGTTVMQDEQNKGLTFVQALTPEQQKKAILQSEKTQNNSLAQAFRDNLVLDYAGLRASDLTAAQKTQLLGVIDEYVGNIAAGHAKVRMAEVEQRLDDTYFAWIGGTGADAVFYYRIQSPVILIEFDHQTPIALPGPKVPGRVHVHTVVRTPNGNDYGKDLLRQHYAAHQHDAPQGHR
jgi:predicted nuclease of restriction endonuclease-like (RecB) superfamily